MIYILGSVSNLVRVTVFGGSRRKQEHIKEGIYKVSEKQLKERNLVINFRR